MPVGVGEGLASQAPDLSQTERAKEVIFVKVSVTFFYP